MNGNEEIIIGLHSIIEAIKNTNRLKHKLYATTQGEKTLRKYCSIRNILDIQKKDPHSFQETAKKIYKHYGFEYHRVPTGLLLLAESTPIFNTHWIRSEIEKKNCIKIVCLDSITDVHNIGAIMRSAAFYGVDALLFSSKHSPHLNPGISKIASGALEHVPLVHITNLSKMLKQFRETDMDVIGLSEHAPVCCHQMKRIADKCALVLGPEDKGLSHSVMRQVSRQVALKAQGRIKSLNVSVAAAIGMQIFLYE